MSDFLSQAWVKSLLILMSLLQKLMKDDKFELK